MSEPTDQWQELLDRLAAGEAVDWDTQNINNESDQQLLDQLKSIQAIEQVFATQQQVGDDAVSILFDWGHLQVLEQLGEGGYGDVYRAFDPVLNRDVALKLLKPDQLAAFHSKLFIEEAQRIAQVRNRHVLAIHGAGVNDGRVGFWSDLIVGQTLVERTKVSHDELLKVGHDMAQALQAVHEAGLVHGDVKAANVMLDQNQQYVLMDFGAGLESGSDHPSNHSVGSPMLMAPELFNDVTKSPASDVYALGCLLFKMATGQYPVKGENVLDVANAHQHEAYVSISQLRVDLPTSMRQLIQTMIHKDPESRPTAKALADELKYIKNEPRRKRKKRLIMGIIMSLFSGLVLAVVGLYFANIERQKAIQEQQKAQAVNDFLQQVLGSAFQFGQGREVRVADMLDVAAMNKQTKFKNQPHALAAISEALGVSYQNLRIHDKSLEHLNDNLDLKTKLYGMDHAETLQAMLHQAKAQFYLGVHEPTLSVFDTVMRQTANQPAFHNMYQMAAVDKANVLSEIGEFKQAEDMVMAILDTVPDPDQSNRNYIFLAYTVLSDNYVKQSKFAKGLAAIDQAAEILKADPHSKATNELVVLNNRGIILSNMNELDAAEQTMRQTLELAEKYYGKNNIGYIRGLVNLGAVLYHQGRLSEALVYQEQAQELVAQVKGLNNKVSILMGINLANTYVSLGNLEQGEALMRKTLVPAYAVLGAQDVETLKLEYNLAELLNNSARFVEAESQARSTLDKALEALGPSHLITLLTEDNLAVSLSGQNKHQEAVVLHSDLLTRITAVFAKQSPYTQLVWKHSVDSLAQAGQQDRAIELQRQLLTVLLDQHGPEHVEVVAAENRISALTADAKRK